MSDHSTIEWTDATWNPVRGCTKISPGCAHCYAETFAERFRGVPGHPYEQGFDLRLVPEKLAEPLRWRRPEDDLRQLDERPVPQGRARRLHRDGRRASCSSPNWHTYQVLTKRSERLRDLLRLQAASGRGRRAAHLVGRQRREPQARPAARSTTSAPPRRPCGSSRSSRCSKTSASIDLGGHRLGDRRRRERPRRPAAARSRGSSPSATSAERPASRSSSSSGAAAEGAGRPRARRPDLRRAPPPRLRKHGRRSRALRTALAEIAAF